MTSGIKRYLQPSDRREVAGSDSFAFEITPMRKRIFTAYYQRGKSRRYVTSYISVNIYILSLTIIEKRARRQTSEALSEFVDTIA